VGVRLSGVASVSEGGVFGSKAVVRRVSSGEPGPAVEVVGGCEAPLMETVNLPVGWRVIRRYWDGPCRGGSAGDVMSASYGDVSLASVASVYVHPNVVNFAEKNVTVGGVASTLIAVPFRTDEWFLSVPVNGSARTVSVFSGGLGREGTLAVGEAMVSAVRAASSTTTAGDLFPRTLDGMDRVAVGDGSGGQRVFVVELRSVEGAEARLLVAPGSFDLPGARVAWALEQGTEELTPGGVRVHRVEASDWDGQPVLRWDNGSGFTITASGAALLAEPTVTQITVTPG